ncbi:PREDICTED: transcription factor IIIB 70 kDa subunit-like isoform X2 [Ipomoea nil]|uniref:transcription factor IIIB 70 kDa subunit-like isoform X2 n=1 Tax=Ipomoea nil TaxID=35883 RepID=UPI000901DB47|nr:PREDICTED: transcription factor IIIB 70 kDa subunit-like isoform X2 [Ipomoea nil]
MVWCSYCGKNVHADNVDGRQCCTLCGRVLSEDNFATEVTFVKNAAGQSQMAGKFVRTVQSNFSASRDRTLREADEGINSMLYALGIDGGDSIANPALRFYMIALERNFTRGRRKEQVQAACLYIACREKKKPFLLIDFSEYLRINVYVLGAVFLQLCKLLSLEEHPIVQKPVDPSLFIHRFTDRLFGERKPNVSRTALHIVASMKRDWMQTGRKPSGICGAALYIASLSYGLKCSKLEIIKVVHICDATLTKRLIEFENTDSGSLTIEEFNTRAVELEKEQRLMTVRFPVSKESGISELLCEHKGSGIPPFAHGLCESCYTDFITISGGLDGGSEPPAFQRAEKERLMAKETDDDDRNVLDYVASTEAENNYKNLYSANGNVQNANANETLQGKEHELMGVASTSGTMQDDTVEKSHGIDDINSKGSDESDDFTDIDDVELGLYLYQHDEEGKRLKKIMWERDNREYLEEQAAKEAAAALASKKGFESSYTCPEEMEAAQKLAAAAAAAVAKSKKEKQQRRAAELRNSGPAKTAAEATQQMLSRKRNSIVNRDVLDTLFDESPLPANPKKSRNDSDTNEGGNLKDNKLDPIKEDGGEEWMGGGEYDNDVNYTEQEAYDYDEQYGFEE